MRRLRIYLDTSVISHLQADDVPEKMILTHKLWETIKETEYEIVISDIFLSELEDCPEPKKTALLKYLQELKYDTITLNMEILELANKYIIEKALPPKCLDDALHIAAASIYGCNAIISWNFKHMVNLKTFYRVNGVNKLLGYGEVQIVSPAEIVSEEE